VRSTILSTIGSYIGIAEINATYFTEFDAIEVQTAETLQSDAGQNQIAFGLLFIYYY